MNFRRSLAFAFVLSVCIAAIAQDAPSTTPSGQPPAQGPAGMRGPRGGRGMGSGMGPGRGVAGTVTAVAADHYTIKTESGETYTVQISANTRIMKQTAQPQTAQPRGAGAQFGGDRPAFAPQTLKATDIKVGDVVAAMGEIDPAAKAVGAMAVLLLDPERAKQMREMQANYGKTWFSGKITAIDGTRVTLMGSVDNAVHAFTADENTTFRKHREPITLPDMQVGDLVRVEGAIKDGVFVATLVAVMGMPPAASPTVPRDTHPPTEPK